MKILNGKLIVLVLFFSLIPLSAMEDPAKKHSFITTTIGDIQELAYNISYEKGEDYQLITRPALVERCLYILGSNTQSTPLEIRYNYDLLLQKLSKTSPLYDLVTMAYNKLIRMLFEFGDYQEDVQYLFLTTDKDIEEIELKEKPLPDDHVIWKKDLTNLHIDSLKKYANQFMLNKELTPLVPKETLYQLPAEESYPSVEGRYNKYMVKNSLHKLIALKKMKEISSQELKNKLFEVEKFREAYKQYLKEK